MANRFNLLAPFVEEGGIAPFKGAGWRIHGSAAKLGASKAVLASIKLLPTSSLATACLDAVLSRA